MVMAAITSVLWRALRGAVATGISLGIAALQNNANLVWLVPVILALGKALREKFPEKLGWLPI